MMKECILYETEDDKKTIQISLLIEQNGYMIIDGLDNFKHSDPIEQCEGYEYWLEIMGFQMPDFVAALIQEHYKSDPKVMEKLYELCLRYNIDVEIERCKL